MIVRLYHPDSDAVVTVQDGPTVERYTSQGWRPEEGAEPPAGPEDTDDSDDPEDPE